VRAISPWLVDQHLRVDGLNRPGARRLLPARLLLAVAAAETLTLVVLLVNLVVSVRSSALAAAIGPVHGGLYLTAVLLTWTAPFPRAIKAAAALPVVGAWVAALHARPVLLSVSDYPSPSTGR